MLDQATKDRIDAMSHYEMLSMWRFAKSGTQPLLQGEAGEYFAKQMAAKRSADPDQAVRDSKDLGWERP